MLRSEACNEREESTVDFEDDRGGRLRGGGYGAGDRARTGRQLSRETGAHRRAHGRCSYDNKRARVLCDCNTETAFEPKETNSSAPNQSPS